MRSGTAAPAPQHGGKPEGRDPPGGPSLTFTRTDQPGPPGGYGIWPVTTGHQDFVIDIGPLPAGNCDHRWQARGHDPRVDAPPPDRGPARQVYRTGVPAARGRMRFRA